MNSKVMNKKVKLMFPEYRELVESLRKDNAHFAKLFEDHNDLDRHIAQLELDPLSYIQEDIEMLKRKKLKLKDELYTILKKAEASN